MFAEIRFGSAGLQARNSSAAVLVMIERTPNSNERVGERGGNSGEREREGRWSDTDALLCADRGVRRKKKKKASVHSHAPPNTKLCTHALPAKALNHAS